jgi:uroporphyrinogen-III synthase
MKLLVIRPQPGADATAARVEGAGHEPLLMPLFAVEPVAWTAPPLENYDALLLTSANAVRQAGEQLSALAQLPVLAVGKVTATAAERAGLNVTVMGEAGVDSLLQAAQNRRLLWLAGEDRTIPVAPDSVQIDTRVVYRSAALAKPANFGAVTLLADFVLLHSARAAARFSLLADKEAIDRRHISIAALSDGIAEAAGKGWKSVRIAAAPNDAALLSCL